MQSIINTIKALDQCVGAMKEIKSGYANTDFLDSMAYYIDNLKAWAGIVEEKQTKPNFTFIQALDVSSLETNDNHVFSANITHEQYELIKRCETNNPLLGLCCNQFTVNGGQVLACYEMGDGNYQLLIGKTND